MSEDQVWAVGLDGGIFTGGVGKSWSVLPSPTTEDLHAVWAVNAKNLWAVGDRQIVVRNTGAGWYIEGTGDNSTLNGLWGLDSSNIWSAGTLGSVRFWNGSSWKNLAVNTDLTRSVLHVYGTDASHIWMTGEQGLLLYFDGASWSRQSTGTTSDLNGIFQAGPKDLWIVGSGGTILHQTL